MCVCGCVCMGVCVCSCVYGCVCVYEDGRLGSVIVPVCIGEVGWLGNGDR